METHLDHDIVFTSENDVEVFNKMSTLSNANVIFADMDKWVKWAKSQKRNSKHVSLKYEERTSKYIMIINNTVSHDDKGNKITMYETSDIYFLYVFFLKLQEEVTDEYQKAYFKDCIKSIRIAVSGWIKQNLNFIKGSRIYNQISTYERH